MPEKYVVHCVDVHQTFTFDSQWDERSLYRKLVDLQSRINFVPGLVFRDENGTFWKPRLVVQLQKVRPEEKNG